MFAGTFCVYALASVFLCIFWKSKNIIYPRTGETKHNIPTLQEHFAAKKVFFRAKHTRFYKKKHIFVMSCMRWKPPRVESGARYIYIKKAYLSALVLTVHELRNFKLLVKNKATGTPLRMFIYALIGSGLQMPSAMMVFYMHRRGAFSVARFD